MVDSTDEPKHLKKRADRIQYQQQVMHSNGNGNSICWEIFNHSIYEIIKSVFYSTQTERIKERMNAGTKKKRTNTKHTHTRTHSGIKFLNGVANKNQQQVNIKLNWLLCLCGESDQRTNQNQNCIVPEAILSDLCSGRIYFLLFSNSFSFYRIKHLLFLLHWSLFLFKLSSRSVMRVRWYFLVMFV